MLNGLSLALRRRSDQRNAQNKRPFTKSVLSISVIPNCATCKRLSRRVEEKGIIGGTVMESASEDGKGTGAYQKGVAPRRGVRSQLERHFA